MMRNTGALDFASCSAAAKRRSIALRIGFQLLLNREHSY
jgi:hypothetical protein